MYPMRRDDRQLSFAATLDILRAGSWGVLSTVGAEGEPYGVPLNYALDESCLDESCLNGESLTAPLGGGSPAFVVFHAAKEGRKLKNLAREKRCSFTVVGEARVLPLEFSTAYSCAMVFGQAEEVCAADEKKRLLLLLADKYSPNRKAEGRAYVERLAHATTVVRLRIEGVSGKARM